MSSRTIESIWELDLPANKMLVLLAYASYTPNDNNPGVPDIAWRTGYSDRQVQRIIHALVADKLLVPASTVNGKAIVYDIDVSAGTKKPMHVTGDKVSLAIPAKMSPVTLPNGQDVTGTGDKMTPPTPDRARQDSVSLSLLPGIQKTKDLNTNTDNTARVAERQGDGVGSEHNIFELYHASFAELVGNPRLADTLKAAQADYSWDWIVEAFDIAAKNNKNWRYAEAILKNWQANGKDKPRGRPPARAAPDQKPTRPTGPQVYRTEPPRKASVT